MVSETQTTFFSSTDSFICNSLKSQYDPKVDTPQTTKQKKTNKKPEPRNTIFFKDPWYVLKYTMYKRTYTSKCSFTYY